MSPLGRSLGPGKLVLDSRGSGKPKWVLCWRDGQGRRHRQQLSSERRLAERMRAELINQRDLELAGLGAVEGQSRPLDELKDLYLADLQHRTGAKHVLNVGIRLRILLAWLGVERVRDVQVIDLMAFRTERLKAGRSVRTVNCTIGALKAMLNWAVAAGLIAENPISRLKPLPYRAENQKRVRRALSDEEIERFLAAAEAHDAQQAAYWAAETTIANGTKSEEYAERRRLPRVPQALLWRTLIDGGGRWGETTRTTWADLDRRRLCLRLRAETTKAGRERYIPLAEDHVRALWALREVHQRARQRLVQEGDRIFLSPDGADWPRETTVARRTFRRVLDRAGIDRKNAEGVVDIHALRHTAATRMVRNGVSLAVAQRVLGHSDPAMTARFYTHLEVEDLRGAVIRPPASRSRIA